jgi:hypothetical protein
MMLRHLLHLVDSFALLMPIELKPTEPVPLPNVEDTPITGSDLPKGNSVTQLE